jgi:hypothetical protein
MGDSTLILWNINHGIKERSEDITTGIHWNTVSVDRIHD